MLSVSSCPVGTNKKYTLLAAVILLLLTFMLTLNDAGLKFYTGPVETEENQEKDLQRTVDRLLGRPKAEWKGTRDVLPPCGVSSPGYPAKFQNLGLKASVCNPQTLIDIERLKNVSVLHHLQRLVSGKVTCPRNVTPAPMSLPSTGLVSWPGSGNTWTRHLIQQMTGIQTGAVYNDPTLKKKGFAEGQTEHVVVIKTHFVAVHNTKIYNFRRQIVVLRNPFDALAAEYKRYSMKAGHNKKVDIVPDQKWRQYVLSQVQLWSYFVRTFLAFRHSQLIVMYEDMKSPCLARELLQIANFLRTANLTKFSLCCSLTNSVGTSYRNQGRVPIQKLYQGRLMEDLNAMLTELAQDISDDLPMLAKRLLDYRIYNDTSLTSH